MIADSWVVVHIPWWVPAGWIFPGRSGALFVPLIFGVVAGFALTGLLGKPYIGLLRRISARQVAYEDAPSTHQAKTGTPTMGGVLFGIAPLVALAFLPSRETFALAVLIYGCMAIGAIDDVAKIRGRQNRGLRSLPKFALTAVATVAFLLVAGPQPAFLLGIGDVSPWLWYGLSICVVLATTHAVNLTDGLDGLASGTAIPPLLVLAVAAFAAVDRAGLTAFAALWVAAAMIGVLLGFLVYNRHPARVFMGDTGSLALGGAIAGITILTDAHLLLLLIGGVFVAETLSVIIQVASYKTTRRRVFRMSPLHHHFELVGWPETVVTTRFWIASLVFSLLGLALISRTAT
ncbi:MAG: phospho-N-acetylmuramoyl-pentapeptide-transferase [Candidatus Eremiobacteraeota bacterium]|nr:phospho-N-acetylmuramoyl-pentapeptide-transferase [Candidatus Eremiobacteraeota bacterium]